MTIEQAIHKANRLAAKNHKEYFVVRDFESIEVADDYDLDTFFMGISESSILYCTSESPVSLW